MTKKILRKTITVLYITLGLFVSVATFSACSSSDDSSDDKGGGEKPSINKRLVKETVESEFDITVTEFTYDNDGKVIQVKYNITYTESSSQNKPKSGTHSITYSDNSILEVSNEVDKWEYTLEDGLITKALYSYDNMNTFTYDNNNYMVTSNYGGIIYNKYIWSEGNLVRREYNQAQIYNKIYTYEYSKHLAPPDFDNKKLIRGSSNYGFVIGFLGKSSKNLPSKITSTDVDKGMIGLEESYEWVIEDGLPVKCIMIKNEKIKPHYLTYTITYEWK